MKKYQDYLEKEGFKTRYTEFSKTVIHTKNSFSLFDPIDTLKLSSMAKTVYESPNFLLTKEDYEKYRKSNVLITHLELFSLSKFSLVQDLKLVENF